MPPLSLGQADPEIAQALLQEDARQRDGLEMIASENYTSAAVREAQGSRLTNKYAEGYPGRRYYGGCENADIVEDLARSRIKQIFGAKFANVQPHSGAQANMAVQMAFAEPSRKTDQNRDVILGMDLAHGGHLTHGMAINYSGMYHDIAGYGVDPESCKINMGQVARLAQQHKGRLKFIIAGGSAYPFQITDDMFADFAQIARENHATFKVDMAHFAGLVAGGEHPNPVPHASVVTGTTHKTLRGPRGGFILTNDPDRSKVINSRVFPGVQGGPLMHVIAAKAVAFGEALKPEFKEYAAKVRANANALAARLMQAGVKIVGGGTETHLMIADVAANGGPGGKMVEDALGQAGITVNKNMIPFDQRKPLDPSGIRIGTPALTTRGMGEAEMQVIGGWIAEVVSDPQNAAVQTRIRSAVRELCSHFDLP